jgi:hypothetical protein
LIDAVKVCHWIDTTVLGGRTYRYLVRACDASGRSGTPPDSVSIAVPSPDYMR